MISLNETLEHHKLLYETTLCLISGRRKSGKDTIANYLNQKLSKDFNIHVLHFADALKELCRDFFGIDAKLLWGTDDDKNQLTHIKWCDLPHYNAICDTCGEYCGKYWDGKKWISPLDLMTVREFLQQFGTNIMRKIWEPVWVYRLNRKIQDLKTSSWSGIPEVFFVPDTRFPNEVEYKFGVDRVVKVRLTRKINDDNHPSETSLDSYTGWDLVIPNHDKTLEETLLYVEKVLIPVIKE